MALQMSTRSCLHCRDAIPTKWVVDGVTRSCSQIWSLLVSRHVLFASFSCFTTCIGVAILTISRSVLISRVSSASWLVLLWHLSWFHDLYWCHGFYLFRDLCWCRDVSFLCNSYGYEDGPCDNFLNYRDPFLCRKGCDNKDFRVFEGLLGNFCLYPCWPPCSRSLSGQPLASSLLLKQWAPARPWCLSGGSCLFLPLVARVLPANYQGFLCLVSRPFLVPIVVVVASSEPSSEISSNRDLSSNMNKRISSAARYSQYQHPTHLHTGVGGEKENTDSLCYNLTHFFLYPLIV